MSGVRTESVRPEEEGMRLDRWLRSRFPDMPHGRMQKALRKGEIRLDGGRAKTDTRVAAGQAVRIPPYEPAPSPDRRARQGPDPRDEAFAQKLVIFRNAAILAVNKPPGLAVQGGTKTERHLDGMLGFLQFDQPESPRLVHRLDRDTSGVMLLARDRETAQTLGRALQNRHVQKIYWAIVVGVPDPDAGTIDLPLAKQGGAGRERVGPDSDEGRRAVTEFRVMDRAGQKLSLVALWPRTGRTHQLRAHMAAIGCPILGDGKYGGSAAHLPGGEVPKGLHLHARSITLPPDIPGAGARIIAPPPPHFRTSCGLFEFDTAGAEMDDPFAEIREME